MSFIDAIANCWPIKSVGASLFTNDALGEKAIDEFDNDGRRWWGNNGYLLDCYDAWIFS